MSREPSSEIDEMVEDMNEAAGKNPSATNERVASSAAKQTKEHGPRRSPRKPSLPVPATDVQQNTRAKIAEPQSSGSRLKRKSTASQQRPSRIKGNVYDPPDEEEDDTPEAGTAQEPKMTGHPAKQRRFGQKTAKLSPFKGKDIIEIPPAAQVNLEDSHSKKPRGRPKQRPIKPTLQASGRRDEPVSEPVKRPARVRRAVAETEQNGVSKRTATKKKNTKQTATASDDSDMHVDGDSDGDEDDSADEGLTEAPKTREEKKGAQEEKRVQDRAKELRDIETIGSLHECDLAWGDLFAATTELIGIKHAGEPESEQGSKICKRIDQLRKRYRRTQEGSEPQDRSDKTSMDDEITSLGRQIWYYRNNKDTAPHEKAKKARDLYGHIVPKLVRVLKKVMHNHQADDDLDPEVSSEMCELLNVTWSAADMAYHWQPRPSQLEDGAKRLMRDDVRKNLTFLKETFSAHRTQYEGRIMEEQRLEKVAKLQRKAREKLWNSVRSNRDRVLAENRKRLARGDTSGPLPSPMTEEDNEVDEEAGDDDREGVPGSSTMNHGLPSPASEAEILDNLERLQIKKKEIAMKERKARIDKIRGRNRGRHQTPSVVEAAEDVVQDVDDLVPRSPSPPFTRHDPPANPQRHERAQTEDIPGPVQPPLWTEDERTALMNSLQHFRGPSRFEQIIKCYGRPGKALERHDLDGLITYTKFLNEHLASSIRQAPEEWEWLTSVPS